MATLNTRRRCPYCGASIKLGDCPIVATSFSGVEFRDATEFTLDEIELPSGGQPLDLLPRSGWPVVARAPREREVAPVAAPTRRRSRLEEAFGGGTATATVEEDPALPPLHDEVVRREDVPARACPECEFPLPQSIDDRPAVVVAVVGVNRVGKTHLLATSLTQAYRQRGLAAIGCTEFVPDDATGTRFMTEYHHPLFRRGELLEATAAEDEEARFRPLVFDVTVDGVAFSLILHDIAGEVLGDHRKRAHAAAYLRGARGIIFVVDPRDIDDLRDGFPGWVLENNELGWDQGALLSACLRGKGDASLRKPVPVAVTIAKADLLPDACGEPVDFLDPAPHGEGREAMVTRIRQSSQAVAGFLERYGAHNVLGPARAYEDRLRAANADARVTYHAVSALGSSPDPDERLTERVKPLNCLDPLAAILMQLTAAGS